MDQEPKMPKIEKVLSPEAREIIALYQKAIVETDPQKQEQICQEFYRQLIKAITPINQKPATGSELYRMKDILLGKGEGRLYIGSGTSGCRIAFDNYLTLPKSEETKVRQHIKDIKVIDGFSNSFEVEDEKERRRWMRYYKPSNNDYKFGGRYWERYMETFGSETVDLLQEIE